MIQKKVYSCEICEKKVLLRQRVKEGEFKDKKVCSYCHSMYSVKKKIVVKNKTTNYSGFFSRMIDILATKPYCENCGCKINVGHLPHNNIAHILSKRTYKSVAENSQNIIFLCDLKDHSSEVRSCHGEFDNDILKRVEMPVFSVAKSRIESIKLEIKERGKELYVFELELPQKE